MVGLTRFLCLVNLCEKSAVWINVHAGFSDFKKHAFFGAAKKLFVLQEICRGCIEFIMRAGEWERAPDAIRSAPGDPGGEIAARFPPPKSRTMIGCAQNRAGCRTRIPT
jgi:hypothetical protein